VSGSDLGGVGSSVQVAGAVFPIASGTDAVSGSVLGGGGVGSSVEVAGAGFPIASGTDAVSGSGLGVEGVGAAGEAACVAILIALWSDVVSGSACMHAATAGTESAAVAHEPTSTAVAARVAVVVPAAVATAASMAR
jgi:hypothetical protein